LLTLTRSGKAFTVTVGDIPLTARNSRGTPLVSLLPASAQGVDPEVLVAQMILPSDPTHLDLVLMTQRGKVKRLPLSDFANLTGRGLTALKLKNHDQLQYAIPIAADEQLVIATSTGRVLRMPVDDEFIPIMGRTAQGQTVMRLRKQEQIIGCLAASPMASLLFVTAKGYAKRIPVNTLKLATADERIGMPIFQFEMKTDSLAAMALAQPETVVDLITDRDRMAHIRVDRVPFFGKDGSGERLLRPARDEQIIDILTPIVDFEL
jgi:DNA gyrase subunit A